MTHEDKLSLAINYIKNQSKDFKYWYHLYPFSTENLTDFFKKDIIYHKNVLLTGSSADQILTAQLLEASKITNFDLNPITEYLYELKKAAIKELDCDNYLSYFYYNYNQNPNSFSQEMYHIIKNSLHGKYLEFWNTLYEKFNPTEIRTNLFFLQEEEKNMYNYKKYLPYLKGENYEKLRAIIDKVKIDYIETDLLNLAEKLNSSYDLIYLSNIFSRVEMIDFFNINHYIKNLYYFMMELLEYTKEDGIIILDYLYGYKKYEIYDQTKKYTHHIRFPIKTFKCYDNILLEEVSTVSQDQNSKVDTVISYRKIKK